MITWLSSYPRSGNTFLRILLKSGFDAGSCSVYNDADISGNAELAAITGHQALQGRINDADFDLESLRAGEQVAFVKTHEISPELVGPNDRVIYVVRDGREATLSHARYERDILQRDVTARELVMGMHFPGGSWADHLRNWNPSGRDDTLLLRFEELVADPDSALDRLQEFTGLPMRSRDIPGFADLQSIDSQFFGSGRKDSYRDEMPPDVQALFWLRSHREMRAMAYTDHAPQWLERLDETFLDEITHALQQAATDLVGRQSRLHQAAQEHATQQQAQIQLRDRQVRELRQNLDSQARELEQVQLSGHEARIAAQEAIADQEDYIAGLEGLLAQAQTQVFQIQDELAHYYAAGLAQDQEVAQLLEQDPLLRLVRHNRKVP